MKLYFFSSDTGCCRYLFAEDLDRATGVFSTYLTVQRLLPSRFWVSEITSRIVPSRFREHLIDALSWEIEGFGAYEHGRGWHIRSVQSEFDAVPSVGAEGDHQ